MRQTPPPARRDLPRPVSAAEIAGKLDALADTIASRAREQGEHAPHPISPSDLLRCLRRLTSLN